MDASVAAPAAAATAAEEALWQRVAAFMAARCGVVLAADQSYLMGPRLGPIARAHGFAGIDALVAAACASAPGHPLQRLLIDAMTTHESSFFRDASFWAALEGEVVPRLRRLGREGLSIWVAASSHGQEALSTAMLLEESFPALWARSRLLATDVSEAAILRARAAVYSPLEVGRGLDARRLARHFERVEGGFRARPRLLDKIVYEPHNLMVPLPGRPLFDLVMCRNVLIYFSPAERRATIERVLAQTAAGGFVGLGSTEQGWRPQTAPGWYERDA